MTREPRWSELDLIRMFKESSADHIKSKLIQGIGDDCAVFENIEGRDWITTTDILVEHIHFDRSWHPARQLGRKSIAVNFSDIAAMGGVPHFAMISIAIPGSVKNDWIEQWYQGVNEMLDAYDCLLIGGDTAQSEVLTINVVVIGSVPQRKAVMRNSARISENIYVSGPLGAAGAGLEICRNASFFDSIDPKILSSMRDQHLDPEPEIRLGALLGSSGMVGAMQDLSDGLATDLAHIAEQSGVGAEIHASALPAVDGFPQVCHIIGKSGVSMQVASGEDYRLLFTVKIQADDALLSLLETHGLGPIHRIGCIVEKTGVHLLQDGISTDISFLGYQHGDA